MPTSRNLSPYEYFCRQAQKHKPRMAFNGKTAAQFSAWQKEALPAVLATTGHRPTAVKPEPELMFSWEEDGIVKEQWIINTQPDLSAYVIIFRPANLKKGERRPAIFCSHGHGSEQARVMGMLLEADRSDAAAIRGDAYGLVMARKGFVTYSIDWLGFGKRDSRRKPFELNKGVPHPCHQHYFCSTLLGTTTMAINLRDARSTTDFVSTLPYVDADRLGVMGLSFGGTMTTWLAIDDNRYKVVDIICYAGPFKDIAFDTYNVCGSQITPGLYDLVDTFDLQGLIAPRPLLVELGVYDQCFQIEHTLNGHYKPLEKIYKAAGASDKLSLDLFPNIHTWGANLSETFFKKYLQANW